MPVTKTVKITPEVLEVLQHKMTWSEDGLNASLTEQIPNYPQVKKVIEQLGGKWVTKLKTHVFTTDPRAELGIILENKGFVVDNYGWFQTPLPVVHRMMDYVTPMGSILEPSAGEGAIALNLGVPLNTVWCVEMHDERSAKLEGLGFARVWRGDFLKYPDANTLHNGRGFDCVFMNPPFEKGQDMIHINHAFSMLKSGGKLVSVASAGVMNNQTRVGQAFQELVNIAGFYKKLPEDSFKESGTRVNTCLVILEKA